MHECSEGAAKTLCFSVTHVADRNRYVEHYVLMRFGELHLSG